MGDALFGIEIDVGVNAFVAPGHVIAWKQVSPRPKYFVRAGRTLSHSELVAAVAQLEENLQKPAAAVSETPR
jgi:hypothetical protein